MSAKRTNGRQWALKFGQTFARQIRCKLPAAGDKRRLDEIVLMISGVKHWPLGSAEPGRAVDQNGTALDSPGRRAGTTLGLPTPAT